MVAQRRGWPNRARGDGGDALRWFDVMVSPRVGVGQVFVPFSRVSPSSFEGAARRPYGGGWHSVTELTLASPHSVVQWQRWPHRAGGWWNSTWAGFPGGVRGPAWRGFALDPGARDVPEHLMLRSGEQAQHHGPEVGDPREPRARWSPTRGGVQPSSEAEFPRGGVGAGCLLGRWRWSGRGCNLSLMSLFCIFIILQKWVFPRL
jgi:hypothetical protein